MDRECIKKHRKEFEAWLEGKDIEFKSLDGGWKDVQGTPLWGGDNIYRVKPEAVHYCPENLKANVQTSCGIIYGKNTVTDDRSKVTCPDCLVKMLPDWVKVGAKCFWNQSNKKDGLYEIKSIDNGFATIESKISIVTTTIKSLTPAVYCPPTYESLLRFAPLALCVKGAKIIITVDRIDEKCVYLGTGGFCYFKDLHKDYTYADGSEIGEWRKA